MMHACRMFMFALAFYEEEEVTYCKIPCMIWLPELSSVSQRREEKKIPIHSQYQAYAVHGT